MEERRRERILIADDNPEICDVVELLLQNEGYEIVRAVDGCEAVEKMDSSIDLAILDVMMPGKSGIAACREIREKSMVPILFLTAKSQDSDKTLGFSAGGDDFLTKPFSYAELIARVKSLIRRYHVYSAGAAMPGENILRAGGLLLNLDTKSVSGGHREEAVSLTEIEFRILERMLRCPGRVFSAQDLYESIWKEPYMYSDNNTVMVHIRNLRKKLEADPQKPVYIKTAWGKGYYIGEAQR